MVRLTRYSALCFLVAISMLIPVNAANKCCDSATSDAACSGCRQLTGALHVMVGTNTSRRCKNVAASATCDASSKLCVNMDNAPLHDNSACSHVVGTTSYEIIVDQCDSTDTQCTSG